MLVKMQRLFILFLCFSFHLQLCYTNYCDADNLDCRKVNIYLMLNFRGFSELSFSSSFSLSGRRLGID